MIRKFFILIISDQSLMSFTRTTNLALVSNDSVWICYSTACHLIYVETKRNKNQEFRKCKQQNDILSIENIRPSSNVWFFLACVVEDGIVHEVGTKLCEF
jgi:hypothetical protein